MILMTMGLITLSSAGEARAADIHHNSYHFITSQFLFVSVGLVIATVLAFVDYHFWKKHPLLIWIGSGIVFILLLLVLKWFGGRAVNGSYRWLKITSGLRLQPSEFAKLAAVFAMSYWMDKIGWKVGNFKEGILCPGAFLLAMVLPVLLETDLGSSMVIAATVFIIIWIAGVKLTHFLLLMSIVGMGGLGFLLTNANRMRRLMGYFNFTDASESVAMSATIAKDQEVQRQTKMALIAIKNGGIFGVGPGQSMQKLAYLPEAHTDFIFAVGAEEYGLFFSIGVYSCFIAFYIVSLYIAQHASDRFGRLLVIGMSFIVFFQAMFNMGVVSAALPAKGMALPFFSYGGTNMISSCVCVGIILSVAFHSNTKNKFKLKWLRSKWLRWKK